MGFRYARDVGKGRWSVVALSLVVLAGVVSPASASHSPPGGIPSKVRSELLAIAEREAARLGELHPHDIEAVSTTMRRASQVLEIGPLFPNAAVYVVAMRGHFRCSSCSRPHAQTGPHSASRPRSATGDPGGTIATLEIEASTMSANGLGFPVHYPRLRRVGTPVRLA
jgi:hypothetical protein